MSTVINNPTAEQILDIGRPYKGCGSDGDEWSVGYVKGDDVVRWYSGIGSEVWAMAKRLQSNPGACVRVRDVGDGVFFDLLPAECRPPAILVQMAPPEVRAARAPKRLGSKAT